MSATSVPMQNSIARPSEMSSARLLRAYATEVKYECLRALRAPAFSIPFLSLPIALYILFGVLLAGSMSHRDVTVAKIMFVNWSVFGVMGPGLFGFGMFVAAEREQGLMTLKRALPMPAGASLLSKMIMAMLFSAIVVITLVAAAVALGHPGLTFAQYSGDRADRHRWIASFLRDRPVPRNARLGQERPRLRQPCLSPLHALGRALLPPAQVGAAAGIHLASVLSGQALPATRRCAES